MRAEIKELWVERLRDGRPQIQDVLARVDGQGNVTGQCCLGVLCEIAEEQGVIASSIEAERGRIFYRSSGHNGTPYNEDMSLPLEVARWAGLPEDAAGNPFATWHEDGRKKQERLAELNDDGTPFTKIADIIEEAF